MGGKKEVKNMPITKTNQGKTIRLLNDAISHIEWVKENMQLDSFARENLDKAIDDINTAIEVNRKIKQILDNTL